MNIEEARLYLEHTSKDDFNLEKWQKENRYQAIQVVLEEIERLNSIIKELREYLINHIEQWNNVEDFINVVEEDEYILSLLDKENNNV